MPVKSAKQVRPVDDAGEDIGPLNVAQSADDRNAPWMKAARAELGVKEVPGPGSNKRVDAYLATCGLSGDATPWCFTPETEILTENGWVRFDELDGEEQVVQVDEAGQASLTDYEPVEKDYDDEVFVIEHRSMSMVCDTGHRWWGRWNNNSANEFRTLDQIATSGLSIPAFSTSATGVDLTDAELTLLAAFISDGKNKHCNARRGVAKPTVPWSIDFEVSKPRKVEALRALEPDHEYTQRKVYGPRTKTPLTVFRFLYTDFFHEVFDEYKKMSRSFMNNISSAQASVFLRAYAQFDGDGGVDSFLLYTSDEQMRDDLVELAAKAGWHPSVQTRMGIGLNPEREAYAIAVATRKKTRTLKQCDVSRAHYTGKLYCVTVPEGRIVVRGGPTSAPVVTGNCSAFTNFVLKEAGVPGTGAANARSWLKWGKELTEPRYGAVCVIARGNSSWQGHVFFVVGWTESHVMGLGGNQGDAVTVARFPRHKVLGFRWPRAVSDSSTMKKIAVAIATGAPAVLPPAAKKIEQAAAAAPEVLPGKSVEKAVTTATQAIQDGYAVVPEWLLWLLAVVSIFAVVGLVAETARRIRSRG